MIRSRRRRVMITRRDRRDGRGWGPIADRSSAALPRRAGRRPWTRLGTVGAGAHVFYELLAGVAMPFASRLGPGTAAAMWASRTAAAYHHAGRQPGSRDPAFAVLNGAYLSAVIAHFLGWPRTTKAGLPWLTECEGLAGPVIAPYNAILHMSAVSAIGGLGENRRGGALGVVVPVVAVPWLLREQRREFGRLLVQAQERPGWWNRRLRTRKRSPKGGQSDTSVRDQWRVVRVRAAVEEPHGHLHGMPHPSPLAPAMAPDPVRARAIRRPGRLTDGPCSARPRLTAQPRRLHGARAWRRAGTRAPCGHAGTPECLGSRWLVRSCVRHAADVHLQDLARVAEQAVQVQNPVGDLVGPAGEDHPVGARAATPGRAEPSAA